MDPIQTTEANLPSTRVLPPLDDEIAKDEARAEIKAKRLLSPPRQDVDSKKSTKRKRAMVLELLATSTNLTHSDIAAIAGTSKKTVSRASQLLRDTGEKLLSADKREIERETYTRLINERVPFEARVNGILGQIADVRFALPAIKYVDQITGVAPIVDQVPDKQPQAMFSLPAGTSISVTVNALTVSNPVNNMVANREEIPCVTLSDSDSK